MSDEMALDGRFADAVVYAARGHRSQVRKGTTIPYLAHVLGVATLVLEFGGSEVQATAAVLHDIVEDQGGADRLQDVSIRFGADVARIVQALSDAAPRPGEPKAPWRQRKEGYLLELREAVRDGSDAVLVAACDKLYNAESIVADATDPNGEPGLDVFARFTASADGTAWYYRSLLSVLAGADLPARLTRRLELAVQELEVLAAGA